jgi:hypothetical protein
LPNARLYSFRVADEKSIETSRAARRHTLIDIEILN